jgi:hypothetical protein
MEEVGGTMEKVELLQEENGFDLGGEANGVMPGF